MVATFAIAPAAHAVTETFVHTGAAQTWTVPAGVSEATFTLVGASGGDGRFGASGGFQRGFGGRAEATIVTTPGEMLQINVGGAGAKGDGNGAAGGFNGGGSSCMSAGSGGGASDVRRDGDDTDGFELEERLIVAGGGGGAGWGGLMADSGVGGQGGSGGGTAGGGGASSNPASATGGGGGTQSTGGAGGQPAGTAGSLGSGGDGAGVHLSCSGGGGGGLYGGGSGGVTSFAAAGGGGGAGFTPDGTGMANDVRDGHGLVEIGYSVTPTLTTQVSAAEITIGESVTDTATLAGGHQPTGEITFDLYGPGDPDCSGEPAFSDTVEVNGNGDYTSGPFTPADAGTYRWIAAYSGDENNNPVAGACNDPGETVVVSVSDAATTLEAHPAILEANPTLIGGLDLRGTIRLSVAATLTDSNGDGIGGQKIAFSAGGKKICTATTNASGYAACRGLVELLSAVLGLGYQAAYAGSDVHAPASDEGTLVRIGPKSGGVEIF